VFDKRELENAFGEPDEGFRAKFLRTVAGLPASENKSKSWHIRWKTAAMAMAVCVILTFAVYGVYYGLVPKTPVDKADVGANWIFIPAPDDWTFDDFSENAGGSVLLYSKGWVFDAKYYTGEARTQSLRETLAGKIFTADGDPLEYFAKVPDSELYRADPDITAVFDAAGNEIEHIYFSYSIETGDYHLDIFTTTEMQEMKELNAARYKYTYEEAIEFLGEKLRLPTVYTENLDAPKFSLDYYIRNGDIYNVCVDYDGNPGIYFWVEKTLAERAKPEEWYVFGATLEECEIAGTRVYKMTDKYRSSYTWAYDGLVYFLRQDFLVPNQFTDLQLEQIIRSMVE